MLLLAIHHGSASSFKNRNSLPPESPKSRKRRMLRRAVNLSLSSRMPPLEPASVHYLRSLKSAKRSAEASSVFARVGADDGGRFPLTGRGDVNTYALFAELFARLISNRGRAGAVVPTGVATDATTAPYFSALIEAQRLIKLISFENEGFIFPGVHHSFRFCLLVLGPDSSQGLPVFTFFLRSVDQLEEIERQFTLSPTEIARINPNTKTAPIFRARADAELTARIYGRVPILVNDANGAEGNSWNLTVHTRIWHMAEDSSWFRTAAQLTAAGYARDGVEWIARGGLRPQQSAFDLLGGQDDRGLRLSGGSVAAIDRFVPLYEAKMIHQFDHRWGTYIGSDIRDVTQDEKASPDFEPEPYYWVPNREVAERLAAQGWTRHWLLGWRDITSAHVLRTVIATAFPWAGSGHKIPLLFPGANVSCQKIVCLVANLSSLVLDYVARQKIGGTSLTYFYLKQLPVLPPTSYNDPDLAYIVPRVLELTYTSHSMASFAHDLGYDGEPFAWNTDRRAQLRAELDAWYARAYGLTRDELRYVLDPADVKGPDYPSETFRVLKKNEVTRFGEYRTARLVLAAYDQLSSQPIAAE